jgi:hypothetical protein
VSDLDLPTIATIVGTWVLVVGTLAFAYWQLRQAQRLHSATTLLELRERFYSERLRQARRELSSWLLQSPRGPETENWEVGIFFELMGSLTHTGVLEKRMVWSAFGTWISAYYLYTVTPVDLVAQWRREANDPLIFAEFEWLAKEMMAFEGRLGPGNRSWATSDAATVLESETHLDEPRPAAPGR